MANDLLLKFAEELKTIREERGFTLQSLYEKTRIELKYIKAIEDANFGIIDDVYMKGFLRSYLKALSLDDVKYLHRYYLAKEGKEPKDEIKEQEKPLEPTEPEIEEISQPDISKAKTIVYNVSADENAKKMKRDFNIIIYIFLMIVVALIIAIVLIVRGSTAEIIIEKPFDEVAREQEERYEMKEDLRDSSFKYNNGKFNVKLKAKETSWFKIKIDENNPVEIWLRKGKDTLVVADKVMELNIGNAPGIELYINNVKTELPGNKTKVKNIRIDPSGINELIKKSGYKDDNTRNKKSN